MKTNPIPMSLMLWSLAAGGSALPAQAAEPAYFPAFSKVDENKDGYISAGESKAVPGLPVYLTTLDQNSDGKLSPAEYAGLKILEPGKAGPSTWTRRMPP
ncbi:hypothetical protein ACWJKU_09915 [Methylocaldum sp. MU1018]